MLYNDTFCTKKINALPYCLKHVRKQEIKTYFKSKLSLQSVLGNM